MNVEDLLRREWLWNHGCTPDAFYCDDGELQCDNCQTDFLRMPIEELQNRVMRARWAHLASLFADRGPSIAAAPDDRERMSWTPPVIIKK